MRLIDANALKKDFKVRLEKAKNWKENALNKCDDEIVIRADATIDFICEVLMTINNAPTVERPHGDLISREALKKYKFTTQTANGVELEDIEVVPVAAIDNVPTVDAKKIEHKAYNEGFKDGVDQGIKLSERPKGKWVIDGHHYKCSLCGKTLAIMFSETDDDDLIGCPFCLADMRGGRE